LCRSRPYCVWGKEKWLTQAANTPGVIATLESTKKPIAVVVVDHGRAGAELNSGRDVAAGGFDQLPSFGG
jgi:hypothetical protein